jgi:PAS domain S-box-containing protein
MYSETSEDLLLELDPAGQVLFADADAARLLHSSESALVGVDWFELFVPPASRDASRADFLAYAAADDDAPTTRDCHLIIDGDERRVLWHRVLLRDDDGCAIGVRMSGALIGADADESRQPMLRDALKRLHELRYALDQASILAITDRRGVIIHANDRFCSVSGYDRDELLGESHALVNSGVHEPEFFKEMWATIGRGHVWKGDVCNCAKDGATYWVATTIVPFVDRRGKPYQYLALRTEITERKRAEAELAATVQELALANERIVREHTRMLQTEKLSSVGMLAAGVAHEINNPLAGVKACVKSLRDGRVTAERRDMYYETVVDGLDRMQGIVTALLNFARPVKPSQTAVNLADIVASCLLLASPHAHKGRVQLTNDVPEPLPRARGDRSQLMQAVMNVVINAIHASPLGGEVVVQYATDGDRVRLSVVDQGEGIPSELLDSVCDPFFSTKPEGQGTGLGLSVTLGIVQAHDGEIDIQSVRGAGTTVTLDLPVWQDPRMDLLAGPLLDAAPTIA